MSGRVAALTALALLAFAGNSLLARAAIGPGADGTSAIGAAAFTSLRLAGGALALAALVGLGPLRQAFRRGGRGALVPAAALALYAFPFAAAYGGLTTATGALVLFGFAQATMGAVAFARGERLAPRAVGGWALAVAGLVALLAPGVRAPDPLAAAAMALAGVAWGVYTLAGRGERAPIAANARNFAALLPLALAVAAWPGAWEGASARGALLALASGALASGGGYAVWYAAVPHLTRTSAAVVQLAVPVVAALGGVALLGEDVSARSLIAGALVLVGIGAAVVPARAVRRA